MSQETVIVVEPAIAKATEELKTAMGITTATPDKVASAIKPLEFKVDDESVDPKYRGKTVADIIKMHENAESRLGTMGQEVGTWRGLVAEMSTKIGTPTTTVQETAPKITSDELLTDPGSSIAKVVRQELDIALKPLHDRQNLNARESELAALSRDFPTMDKIGDDPNFQRWAVSSPGRKADTASAAKGDMNAGRRLLEAWTDRQSFATGNTNVTTETGKTTGIEGARAAATEAGGTGGAGSPTGKIIHKSDVVDLIISNPNLYSSDAYQRELLLAAKEGRLQ